MALNYLTQTGAASLVAGPTSSNVALPTTGSPTTALVTNLGTTVAYVLLGNSEVTVSQATGVAVLPGQSLPLGIGSSTNLAAICDSQAPLNIAVGT